MTGAIAGVVVDSFTGIGAVDEGGLTLKASVLSLRALSRSQTSSLVAGVWSSLSVV